MKNKIISILSEGEIGHGLLIENDAGYTVKSYMQKSPINETTNSLEPQKDDIIRVYVDCILQKAGVQNRNGRIYSKEILVREVNKYLSLIESNASFGQNDHPEAPTVSLKRDEVSHIIKKAWWEGDTLWGTLELITSKAYHKSGIICCAGDHIANILERGYKIGISSRGLGSVKMVRGANIVQNDFELVCWDIVSSPSTPDAYLYQDTAKRINEEKTPSLQNNNQKNKNLLKFLSKK